MVSLHCKQRRPQKRKWTRELKPPDELEREVSLRAKRRLMRPHVGELALEVVVKTMFLNMRRRLQQVGENQDVARAAAMWKLTMSKSSLR